MAKHVILISLNCFFLNLESTVDNIFATSVVRVCNNLPADVLCAECISVSVNKLKCVDFSQFLIDKV